MSTTAYVKILIILFILFISLILGCGNSRISNRISDENNCVYYKDLVDTVFAKVPRLQRTTQNDEAIGFVWKENNAVNFIVIDTVYLHRYLDFYESKNWKELTNNRSILVCEKANLKCTNDTDNRLIESFNKARNKKSRLSGSVYNGLDNYEPFTYQYSIKDGTFMSFR